MPKQEDILIDTDVTSDPDWIEQDTNRILGWELFRRFCFGEWEGGMNPNEMYDKIGVRPRDIQRALKSARKVANETK